MISTEKTEKQEETADLSGGRSVTAFLSGRPLAVHNSYQPLTTWACQPLQQSLLITDTPHIDCSADTTHCSLYLMHPMAVLRGSQGATPTEITDRLVECSKLPSLAIVGVSNIIDNVDTKQFMTSLAWRYVKASQTSLQILTIASRENLSLCTIAMQFTAHA